MDKAREKHCGIKIFYHFFLYLIVMFAIVLPIKVNAEPTVTKVFTQQGSPSVMWYVSGMEGTLSEVGAAIGTIPCEVVTCGKIREESDLAFRTIVLLDNSLSISQPNREKAKELVSQVIQNHVERETFEIYTFSTELHQIGSGTNYDELILAVQNVAFENQDAYLIECVAQILSDIGKDRAQYYNRILLISDGVDDNVSGRTFSELMNMLEDDDYRCPIHTIASIWEKDKTGVKDLSALSRKVGAQSFILDEYEDVSQIVSQIDLDYDADYFMFDLPLEEKDGTVKLLQLEVNTSQGTFRVTREINTPIRTQEEEDFLNEQVQTDTEDETDIVEEVEDQQITEAQRRVLVIVEPDGQEETEAKSELETSSGKYPLSVFIGIGIGLLALLLALLLLRTIRRRRKSVWDERDDDFDYWKQNENDRRQKDTVEDREQREMTCMEEHPDSHNGDTVGMWDNIGGGSGKNIILNGIDNNSHYDFVLRYETLIGRDSLCSVVLKDKKVSRKHCQLTAREEELYIEDMGSKNGTFVNGERVIGEMPIHPGDILKVGDTSFKVGVI